MSIHKKTDVFIECILRKNIIYLVNRIYHNSVVISTKNIRKGGVIVYKKFEKLLVESNKTPYRVSKDTGIAQSLLSDWKLGKIKMLGADKLKILADYFGVSIEYFLEE